MHDGHHKVSVHLSNHQLSRARNGHQIQLSHEQIGRGPHVIHAHPETHKRLVNAHHNSRGARVHLTHYEMANGKGFFDKVKTFFKDNGSTILNGIQGAVNAVAPELSPYTNTARDLIKSTTGYGLKRRVKKKLIAVAMSNENVGRHPRSIHHKRYLKEHGGHVGELIEGEGEMFSPNVNESIRFMPGNLPKDGFHGIGVRKHKKRKHKGKGIYPAGY